MKKSIHTACHTVLLSALIVAGIGVSAHAAPKQVEKAASKPAAKASAKASPKEVRNDAASSAAAAAHQAAPNDGGIFARIGDHVITFAEYDNAFQAAARGKFYHGRAPEKDLAAMQRTVAEDLVNRVLLAREAKRRGVEPDHAAVKKQLDGFEARYGKSDQWKKNKDAILPVLTAKLEEDSIVEQLEKTVRAVPDPERAEVMAYYNANPEKFTEPERVRVSVILAPVPPNAMHEEWDKAAESITAVLKQIREGADFAEMAKTHSKAPSAAQGGDMGYLHKGMLPEPVLEMLGTLKVGEVSEVLRLLEGIGLMKLTERVEPKKHDFERVEQRARDLLKRDNSDAAWKGLIAELRKASPAEIDETRFLPLAADSAGNNAAPK
ncbi:peptidylprolyl isomerase [Noviherbaspirillum sp. ST9]|uniref:peptidylprolyl isomerase n=1 Tax=Noviherbaspirillum sp. ST9 TaxID=3401606 RepID=UPI003B58993E